MIKQTNAGMLGQMSSSDSKSISLKPLKSSELPQRSRGNKRSSNSFSPPSKNRSARGNRSSGESGGRKSRSDDGFSSVVHFAPDPQFQRMARELGATYERPTRQNEDNVRHMLETDPEHSSHDGTHDRSCISFEGAAHEDHICCECQSTIVKVRVPQDFGTRYMNKEDQLRIAQTRHERRQRGHANSDFSHHEYHHKSIVPSDRSLSDSE